MNYQDFMNELCKIVSQFREEQTGGISGPCICLENEIAKKEKELNTWSGSSALLHDLRVKLLGE